MGVGRLRAWGAAAALACASAGSVPAATPTVGQPAPDFTLKLVDGGTVKLSELRGQVVVLNFWATWCVPCRKELPMLDSYYRFRKGSGLRVFAVTTEDSVPLYAMRKLFAVMAIPPVRSVKGPYGALAAVPTNFIINRAGTLRYAKANAFEVQELDRLIVPLLNEPAAPPVTTAAR